MNLIEQLKEQRFEYQTRLKVAVSQNDVDKAYSLSHLVGHFTAIIDYYESVKEKNRR